jgi:uncharacterized membrane protein YqaE (UPF0057 family)
MKSKIKLLLAGILMLSITTSCITCQKPYQEGERNSYEECGFGEEANLDKVEMDHEPVHASPAADRNVNNVANEVLVSEINDVDPVGNSKKKSFKNKRSDKKLGSHKKTKIKDVLKAVKEAKSSRSDDAIMIVLLVILALILPPLAVGIYEGITGRFWLVLVLWLLGWGVGWWLLGPLGWLCSLVAVIMALLIVLGVW